MMALSSLAKGEGLKLLARFASGVDLKAMPSDIVEKAKACLLYGLAVGVASMETRPARLAAAALDLEYGNDAGPSTRLVDGRRVAVGAAAFANSALLHARVQEDAHPAGHMGVVVIPAALAVAERVDAAGDELLAAIIAGYEIALRIGRDHAADLSNRGLRTTSSYGVFAAAATTARLMRLDEECTLHALALAANLAGGLREFVNAGSEEYPYQAGFAARNGISAASCAHQHIEAASTSLDGAAGFFPAYGEPSRDYDGRLVDGLGAAFEMREITYKPFPACQFLRSVIRGVLEVRARAPAAQLDAMVIRMNPFEADFFGVRHAGPYTTFSQTFMSAPFCAALAWSAGKVTYRGMHDFNDAALLRSVARIEIVSDAARPRYRPRLEIRCADGASLDWEAAPGSDTFKLTWDAAVTMTHSLCDEIGISESRAAGFIRSVEGICEDPGSIRSLMSYVSTMKRES
jgi:2-methylcitrate dehydratase PrpD